MSRIYGKYLYEADSSAVSNYPLRVRYIKASGYYEFVGWSRSLGKVASMKIFEPDLLAMITYKGFRKVYLSPDTFEYDSVYMEADEVRANEIKTLPNTDDDTYEDISLLQYLYCISLDVLKKAKRQFHLYKLGRVSSIFVIVPKRDFLSYHNRGRKLGSIAVLSEEETNRIEQNLANANKILSDCVEKDRYEVYIEFWKDYAKLKREKISPTKIKWNFLNLRYKHKIDKELTAKDKKYEAELTKKIEKYGLLSIRNVL